MSLLKRFSDFDSLMALGFTEELSPDGLEIRQRGAEYAVVRNAFGAGFAVDPDICLVFPCQTAHVGQAQFSALKVRGERESTIGYVFPLATLIDGSCVEGEWPRKYGWVAGNALLRDPERFLPRASDLSLSSLSVDGHTPLDHLYPERLSVAVVGLTTLQGLRIESDVVRLMLMASGLRFPRTPDGNAALAAGPEWTPTISCPRPVSGFKCDDTFELLVELADSTDSPVGAFISLYQNFELLLTRIFEASVRCAFSEELTPWQLKDRLAKVTSERWRFGVLDRVCIDGAHRSLLSELSNECLSFLQACGDDIKEGSSWWQLLYQVRNIIVHGQHRVVKGSYYNLESLNVHLRNSGLSILLCYQDPEGADVWAGDES